jgi:uncharacterized protein (UPF0548 family)
MKLFLTDQSYRFDKLLVELIDKPVMTFDKTKLIETVSEITIPTNKSVDQINLDVLFDYHIFPSNIMTSRTQWDQELRKMKVGDTILQQVTIPPVKTPSQKIIFGVRINNIIDEDERKGFSYETLVGHVEKGESAFTIERRGHGLIFRIKTFSEGGNLLTRLIAPLFTVPYQAYCTRRALENVKKQILR